MKIEEVSSFVIDSPVSRGENFNGLAHSTSRIDLTLALLLINEIQIADVIKQESQLKASLCF